MNVRRRFPVLFAKKGTPSPPSFVPTDITGLLAWWDFSDITTLFQDSARTTPVTADGDVIGGVTDKSTANRHLSQSVSGKKPIYKAAIQNGRGVARLDGADDYLASTSSILAAMTVFVVARSSSTAKDYVISFADSSKAIIQGFTAGKIEWFSTPRTVIGNISTTNFQNIYTTLGTAAGGDNKWGLGIQIISLSDAYGGDIGETLIYNSVLSAGNIALVNSYLSSKWSIA